MLQLIYITALLDCMKGKDEIAIVAIKGFKIFVSTYKIIVLLRKPNAQRKYQNIIVQLYFLYLHFSNLLQNVYEN